MSLSRNHIRFGRAGWALLIACALAIGGCLLIFNRPAQAQASGNDLPGLTFSPVQLKPSGPAANAGEDNQGIIAILIGLLLPAVQNNNAVPFKVQVICDGSVVVLNVPPTNQRSFAFFDVFLTRSPRSQNEFVVHLRNRKTQQEVTAYVPNGDMVVRVLPAVQNNRLVMPLSLSQTSTGKLNTVMGDGSVLPVPFRTVESPINAGK